MYVEKPLPSTIVLRTTDPFTLLRIALGIAPPYHTVLEAASLDRPCTFIRASMASNRELANTWNIYLEKPHTETGPISFLELDLNPEK